MSQIRASVCPLKVRALEGRALPVQAQPTKGLLTGQVSTQEGIPGRLGIWHMPLSYKGHRPSQPLELEC